MERINRLARENVAATTWKHTPNFEVRVCMRVLTTHSLNRVVCAACTTYYPSRKVALQSQISFSNKPRWRHRENKTFIFQHFPVGWHRFQSLARGASKIGGAWAVRNKSHSLR